MFPAHCTTANSGVLLSESSITAMRRTAAGTQLDLECHCGERVSLTVDRPAMRPA